MHHCTNGLIPALPAGKRLLPVPLIRTPLSLERMRYPADGEKAKSSTKFETDGESEVPA